jgi:hypothetical protein
MISAYYDASCDSHALFSDLAIASTNDFSRHINQYHVLYLDMAYIYKTYVADTNTLHPFFESLKAELNERFSLQELSSPIPVLLHDIVQQTGRKFVILIDEWDAFFREAKHDIALHKSYVNFLSSLFKNPFTDHFVVLSYLTGILPIKKYGTHSALTDFSEYTMLSPGAFAPYIGFTKEEVIDLCHTYNLDISSVKSWYNGYTLQQIELYNPCSIRNVIERKQFASYWTQTETYESLASYIRMDFDGLKECILQLLSGSLVPIQPNSFQNDITSIQCKDDVLTLLVHLGYLSYLENQQMVRIPNKEIECEFLWVASQSKETTLSSFLCGSRSLLESTIIGDEAAVAQQIEKIHNQFSTPLFYNNEQALRSVVKLSYLANIDYYELLEEVPSGKGFVDLVYVPKTGVALPVLLIELKMTTSCDTAMEQILKNEYQTKLASLGNELLCVAISYDPKTKVHQCSIKGMSC